MSETFNDIYITALRNTHAVELQALQIMERQVERLEHYPKMEAALRKHIKETHKQRDRLEEALKDLDATPSTIKEGFLGFVGNMMALGHVPAHDEILKNTYANHAFENFEIAAYRSLITIADAAGRAKHLKALEQSLSEEQAMAKVVEGLIQPTTRKYLALTKAEEKASV